MVHQDFVGVLSLLQALNILALDTYKTFWLLK